MGRSRGPYFPWARGKMRSEMKRIVGILLGAGLLIGLGVATSAAGLSTHGTFILLASVLAPLALLSVLFATPKTRQRRPREEKAQTKYEPTYTDGPYPSCSDHCRQ